MNETLNKLLAAADAHGQRMGDARQASDLQRLLGAAWQLLSVSQKLRMLKSNIVAELSTTGGGFETQELTAEIEKSLTEMEAALTATGFSIVEIDGMFSWEFDGETSEDFYAREDAVVDAFAAMGRLRALSAGYRVHHGTSADGALEGLWWWSLFREGMNGIEASEGSFDTEAETGENAYRELIAELTAELPADEVAAQPGCAALS
jgi:hypothetical protein